MKAIRTAFFIFVCTLLSGMFIGCNNSPYKDKKELVRAVEQFYDMIVAADISALYSYFPDSFTTKVTKEQFLKSVEGQSVSFVLNAFALTKIQRYKIHSVKKIGHGAFQVTVHIYPEANLQKMADIMTWKYLDGKWVNTTYSELVEGLIENVKQKQQDILKQLFELKQCKNAIQELILALFDFMTTHNMGLADFSAVESDKWVSVLEKEGKFVSATPHCPSEGIYTVTYDRSSRKLIFSCSKHTAIAIPFEFKDMTAPESALRQTPETERSTP
ncbi:MAG: hypothetical protein RBU23_00685 [Candidatus Auribacterota bacterium]|jgi:hypothetical protein|nr:hypothetical protein [Candidatus Auribacterota bacterium]